MLFQEIPAETTNYMILGYTIIFGTLGVYLFSLISRWRNIKKDKELLEELVSEENKN